MRKIATWLLMAITLSCSNPTVMAESATETDAGLLSTGLLQGWKRELAIGINGSEGNSETLNLHAEFNANYEDPTDIWRFDSAYDRSSSDGVTSRNQFFADLQKDWLWPDSPWFAFAQGRYNWDEFREWDSRISLSAGPGYQFVLNDTWNIRGRIGLGGNQTFGGEDDRFTPEALLALNADWTISERESVAFATTFFPSLEDAGEFRNLTTLDWMMSMGESGRLAMKIGLSNEYDSQAAEGIDKNDFKYTLSLVWGL